MSTQFTENSLGLIMKKKSIIENNVVLDGRIFDTGRNVELVKTLRVDIYDPLGRASLIEENLKAVFRKLNSRGISCFFSVGSSDNRLYKDQYNELILHVNDTHALTNKDRFKLDRPISDAELDVVAEFFLRTLEVACFYKF